MAPAGDHGAACRVATRAICTNSELGCGLLPGGAAPPRKRAIREAVQRRQPLTDGRVEPLDVDCVDHPAASRAAPQRLDACLCACYDSPLGVDDTPLGVLFHHLCHEDIL